MLIALEGMDASGKATQAKVLSSQLRCRLISFPTYDKEGASAVGPVITDHLQKKWSADWRASGPGTFVETHSAPKEQQDTLDALIFQCAMTVNKYEMAPLIKIRTDYGEAVVLDRYWQSGYAFGAADRLDPGWLINIHKALPQPNLNILLDIDYATSLARRPERRDRYEAMGEEYFEKVRANYLHLWRIEAQASKLPGRWFVLDGKRGVSDLAADIENMVRASP